MAFDDENTEQINQQLRDEAITMLGAGHETTANALIFIFDLLARNPEAYARVREESLMGWAGHLQR